MDTPENPYAGPTEPSPPGPAPGGAPPRRGPSGCAIALLVVAGLGVLATAAVAVAVYRVVSRPEVREMFGAVAGMWNAPGREELRAAGCEDAMIMDMRPVARLARRQAQEAAGEDGPSAQELAELEKLEQLDSVYALCVFHEGDPSLDCDAVARTFLGAVPEPPPSMVAVVQRSARDEPVCARRYDARGRSLGDAALPEGSWEFEGPGR